VFAFHRAIGQAFHDTAGQDGNDWTGTFSHLPMTSTVGFRRNSISVHSRQATYRLATLLWAAALLIASLQPWRAPNFHFSIAHHVAHFLGFGVLAFFATVGFGKASRISLWPAAASFLFGFSIEFLQHLQNRKPIEWHDVRDNAIGIIVLTACCHMVYRRTANAEKGPLSS
jgi:hypothetical protein